MQNIALAYPQCSVTTLILLFILEALKAFKT